MPVRKDNTFKLTQLNTLDDEVTGSMMLLEVDGLRIMLDCGLVQNDMIPFEQLYSINKKKVDIIKNANPDYIVCGHENYDHISALPFVTHWDFAGKIIMTELASELTAHILRDAVKIHKTDIKLHSEGGKILQPLYTEEDVEKVITMIRGYSYEQNIILNDRVTLQLLPSGHIAGAALIYIEYKNEYGKSKSFMYCPDMYYGNIPRPFTKSIQKKTYKANMVVLEGTYGDKEDHPKEKPIDMLEMAILETCMQNKILWIPCFSLQRSTQICYLLDEIFKRNEIIRNKNIPIYNVGRLTKQCHETIGKRKYREFYDDVWNSNRDIFDSPIFGHIVTKKDVEHFIFNNQVKIVLSSSGSINKGFSNLIASSYIANKKVNILASGYIFPESTLDKVSKGEKKVVHNGMSITRRCGFLGTIPNLSGHVDLSSNIKWIESFDKRKLQKVVIIHGNSSAKFNLKQILDKKLPNVDIIVPKYMEVIKA